MFNRRMFDRFLYENEYWRFLLLLIVFAAVVFAPAYGVDYLINDDYYYFTYDHRLTFLPHPQFIFFNLVGRELYNVVATPMAWLLYDLPDFAVVRMIAILFLVLVASFFAWHQIKAGLKKVDGLLLAMLLIILPGFQAATTWITMVPFFVALGCGIGAGVLVDRFAIASVVDKPTTASQYFSFCLPIIVLVFGLFVYQPWAMSFLWVSGARILFHPLPTGLRTIRYALFHGVVFFVACALYFVLHKLVLLPIMFVRDPDLIQAYDQLGVFKFELAENPIVRAYDLLVQQFMRVFSVWGVGPNSLVSFVGVSLVFFGIGSTILPLKANSSVLSVRVMSLVLVLGLFVASLSPYFLSANGHSGFRVILPGSGLLVLIIVNFFRNISFVCFQNNKSDNGPQLNCKKMSYYVFLCVVLAMVGWSAHTNVKMNVQNAVTEYRYLESKILGNTSQEGFPKNIHIVRPQGEKTFNGRPIYGNGEFNYMSSANWPNVPWMVRTILITLSPEGRAMKVFPTQESAHDTERDPDSGVQVSSGLSSIANPAVLNIDMNQILPQAQSKMLSFSPK